MARTPRTTFRLPLMALLFPALLAVCVIPLAGVGGWWNLMYLVPVAGLVWILLTHTSADADGVRVSGLLRRRSLPWSSIDRLELDGQRWVVAVERTGRRTRMPMVLTRDLPQLAEASGGAFDFTEPQPAAVPASTAEAAPATPPADPQA